MIAPASPEPTLPELRRLRLVSQGLGREGAPLDAVVERLLALQGQDLPAVLWAIGVRAPGVTVEDVRGLFDRGVVVRSWPFRGTLFAIPAADLGWVRELTAERTLRSAARRRRELEIDEAVLAAATTVAEQVLAGGRGLTRSDLLAAFTAAGIATADGRGYHLLLSLSLLGTLVLGPFEGTQQRFVLADEWITAPRRLERDEALGELVRRYLAGHGPSPESDIAWWSKLPLRDVRRGLDVARSELTTLGVAGVVHWAHAPTLDRIAGEPARTTLLLPGFDEWVLGHRDRDVILRREHAPRIVPGNNGVFKPTIVHRGQVVGLWSRKAGARATVVTPVAFDAPLARTIRSGIATAAGQYATYLGAPVEVASEP